MNCYMKTKSSNIVYLKDFRVQLAKGNEQNELRHKEVMILSKNMTYRFTLCNTDDSKGNLIIKVKDNNKIVFSSFNEKTGKSFSYIDFICNKTGTYQIYLDFIEFEQGSGLAVVSLIK